MTQLVYIVGSSYSGSTLLGMLLGRSTGFFNAGELKALGRVSAANEICSCGKPISSCSFWSKLLPMVEGTMSRPSMSDWVSTAAALFRSHTVTASQSGKDHALIAAISTRVFTQSNDGMTVDVSKSLWRLNRLLKDPELSIKSVWIRKSLPASIGSLIKRGRGFWLAMFQAILTDWANRRFLDRRTPDYSTIWYEQLATTPDSSLTRLFGELGIHQSRTEIGIRPHSELHLATGNDNTKLGLSSDKGIEVRLDPSWLERLTSKQRSIAIYLARKFDHPIDVYFDGGQSIEE